MPKIVKPLSATEINNAKPKNKDYRLTDGDGLALLVYKTGKKRWVFSYTSPITKKILAKA